MASPTLSLDNEVFAKFAFYAGVVLLKTVFMGIWTARFRIANKVFVTPEDYKGGDKTATALTSDPDVERVKRCHQNDLENVLPFVLIGLLYVLSDPSVSTATLVFRVFAGSRILHTVAYLNAWGQPTRGICYMVNTAINLYMVISVLMKTSF